MSQAVGTILLVEDEDSQREALIELLSGDGYRIVAAENGEIGLQRLKAEPFGLVVLDLMMPVVDGFEFLRTVRADPTRAATKVIVVSAMHDAPLGRWEPFAVVKKPYTYAELRAVILRALA
jgi:CheY-like chemotaxis protein